MTPDVLKAHCLIRICDDDEDLAAALELFLNLEGWKTVVFHDAKSFLTGDRPSVPGCLILDVKMPGFSGLECQALMKEHGVKLPVIFITGHGDIDMAVQAVLDGACDFLQKPVDEKRLLRSLEKAAARSYQEITGACRNSRRAKPKSSNSLPRASCHAKSPNAWGLPCARSKSTAPGRSKKSAPTIRRRSNAFWKRPESDMPTVADILETPENRSGGLLVVTMPHTVPEVTASRRAFLSDRSVDRGPVLERFCEWFSLWGMPLQRTRGKESAFERAFALALWPAREPADVHGPQFVKAVAPQVPELLKILEARRPRLVIFLSAYLWQAVTAPDTEALTAAVCGKALDTGRRLSDTRLAAWVQKRKKCVFLALPQPSKNTTDTVVRSWAAAIQRVFTAVKAVPDTAEDPLLTAAAQSLVLDPALSVRRIQSMLHVPPERAAALFDALKERVWSPDAAGNPCLLSKMPSQDL